MRLAHGAGRLAGVAGFGLLVASTLSLASAQPIMPSTADPHTDEIMAKKMQVINAMTPVTQETLSNPRSGDWVNWRHDYAGWGYVRSTKSIRRTSRISNSRGPGRCRPDRRRPFRSSMTVSSSFKAVVMPFRP